MAFDTRNFFEKRHEAQEAARREEESLKGNPLDAAAQQRAGDRLTALVNQFEHGPKQEAAERTQEQEQPTVEQEAAAVERERDAPERIPYEDEHTQEAAGDRLRGSIEKHEIESEMKKNQALEQREADEARARKNPNYIQVSDGPGSDGYKKSKLEYARNAAEEQATNLERHDVLDQLRSGARTQQEQVNADLDKREMDAKTQGYDDARNVDSPEQAPRAQDAQKQTAPSQDAPEQNAPTQEAPKQDAPSQDAPSRDAPEQNAPTQDAPKQDALSQTAPTQDAPEQKAPEQSAPAVTAPQPETKTIKAPEQTQEAPVQNSNAFLAVHPDTSEQTQTQRKIGGPVL